MKVALLFAGRIKAFEKCVDSFNQAILGPLEGHEVDGYAALNAGNHHAGLERFLHDYRIRKYEDLSFNINLYDDIPLDPTKACSRTSFKMYYCWYRAFKLMEESGISYDVIISMRADQFFYSKLILPRTPLPNILYVPAGEDHGGGLNDQIAFGNFTVMKHYTNIYNCILDIFRRTNHGFHTETYVRFHNTGVFPIQRVYLHYSLHPDRHR
jgi:hypothetical protein